MDTKSTKKAYVSPSSQIVRMPLSELHCDPANARLHGDKNIAAIKSSLQSFQQVEPLVVQSSTNKIIGGNGRYGAMKDLGWTHCDVVLVDLDATESTALGISLNRTAELAEWDDDTLSRLLSSLDAESIDLDSIGFDDEDLNALDIGSDGQAEHGEGADPHDSEEHLEPRAMRGDIWGLGKHVLYCGSNAESGVVSDIMEDASCDKIDAVVTDPPYGISVVKDAKVGSVFSMSVAKKGVYRPIEGDKKAPDVSKLVEMSDCTIIWGGNYFSGFLPSSNSWLVWDKRCDSGIENTFADCEMAWSNYGGPARVHRQLWNGMIREGEREKRMHPTQKPIKLMAWCLGFVKGKVVFDPYAGSGSTLIAAEQEGKVCLACEIDPLYCDVIIDRWEKLTGEKAVKKRNRAHADVVIVPGGEGTFTPT